MMATPMTSATSSSVASTGRAEGVSGDAAVALTGHRYGEGDQLLDSAGRRRRSGPLAASRHRRRSHQGCAPASPGPGWRNSPKTSMGWIIQLTPPSSVMPTRGSDPRRGQCRLACSGPRLDRPPPQPMVARALDGRCRSSPVAASRPGQPAPRVPNDRRVQCSSGTRSDAVFGTCSPSWPSAPENARLEQESPGGSRPCQVTRADARAQIPSSMVSVSFPVNVFCWLGW